MPERTGPLSPTAVRALQWAWALNLVALVVAGLVERVYRLGSVPGLNSDEYYCLMTFRGLVAGDGSGRLSVPTGRVLDFFYAVPAWLLDLALPRSAASIRAASVLSGFLVAPVAWWALRRARSSFVAGAVAALAIVSPVQISYSRIGWEYSQIPVATLLIVAAALAESVWWVVPALAAGLLVHPAVAYLAPLAVLSVAFKLLARLKNRSPRRLALLGLALVAGVGVFGAVVWTTMKGLAGEIETMLAAVPGNLANGAQWGAFAQLYANLFGVGVSRQNLTDTPSIVFGAATWAFLGLNALLYVGYFARLVPRARKDPATLRELPVVVGLLLALVGFYLTRGPAGITPPYERYALFLVTPTLVVLAVMAEGLATRPWARGAVLAAVGVTCWALVVEFKRGYFDYFETTGGENAHITYHTNSIDPKDAAVRWVQARRPDAVLYTKEWRTWWPVSFVASADPRLRTVSLTRSLWNGGLSAQEFGEFLAAPGSDFAAMLRAGRGYVIGYPDGGFEGLLGNALPGAAVSRKDFIDVAGQPVLCAWYVEPAPVR